MYNFVYLSTTDVGLHCMKTGDKVVVEGFVDSDYVGDKDSRKSTSAKFYMVCGNYVSWKSQIQPFVVLSTIEAEYIATTKAIKEGI